MATGAVPVRIRTATHFSSENFHRETDTSEGCSVRRGRSWRVWPVTHNLHILNLPVDGLHAVFFQEVVGLAERSAAEETAVGRQGAGMRGL